MKKEILYLTEYLAKSEESPLHTLVLECFTALELYTPTTFRDKQILSLMDRQGLSLPRNVEEGSQQLDRCLENSLPREMHDAKKTLFMTLLHVNFPKKKGFLSVSLELFLTQLEPVEKSIYENLLAYVLGINRALALFCMLGKDDAQNFTPERLVLFAESLHVKLVAMIFNEEEKALLSQGLRELLGVYLRLYGKYLYM